MNNRREFLKQATIFLEGMALFGGIPQAIQKVMAINFQIRGKKVFLEQMRLLREKVAEGIIGTVQNFQFLLMKTILICLIATTELHARMAADFILK